MLASLLPLLLLFLEATASSLTIIIPPSNLLPNQHSLPASTHATLTSISHANQPGKSLLIAPLTRSSTFVFRNLQLSAAQPESFLLDIRSSEYVFSPYRVDVSADGTVLGVWETFRGNPWDNRGPEKFLADAAVQGSSAESSADVTVAAKLVARKGFYEERAKFSPLDLFKNPMILLAVVALGFTLGVPKLMKNMDPELRAEFDKHSRSSPISGATRSAMQGSGGPGGFDLAGWMAGASPGPVASAEAASEGAATGREGGGATRRRG